MPENPGTPNTGSGPTVGKIEHEPRYGDAEKISEVKGEIVGVTTQYWAPVPPLSLNEYQRQAKTTDMTAHHGFPYYALGVAGEAGEVAEKVKKFLRDDNGVLTPERAEAIKKELGDVMWYVALLADKLGVTLEEVAQGNLDKLAKRYDEGKLSGDGDDR